MCLQGVGEGPAGPSPEVHITPAQPGAGQIRINRQEVSTEEGIGQGAPRQHPRH